MAARPSLLETGVFLNLPYKRSYEPLLLAYVAGLASFGLSPRAAIEIPGGRRRLERIFDLLAKCRFSIHDVSCVQLDAAPPRTPRFNMPFELGLAVAWEMRQPSRSKHVWFVFESRPYRLNKSLSDLDGSDPHIHGGTTTGVFRELNNAFSVRERQPTVESMLRIYRELRRQKAQVLRESGADTVFSARPFKEIVVMARRIAESLSPAASA